MFSTRILMTASSICLAIAGLACLFMPSETLSMLGIAGSNDMVVQLLGAMYLGSAAANWTARGSMIGGIYARPLTLANFFHFLVGASLLAKDMPRGLPDPGYLIVTLVYLVFAILFVLLLFGRVK